VEGQQLPGNLRDAPQLLARQVEIVGRFRALLGVVTQKIDQVRDRVQRIANFVSNGCSQPSGLGEAIAGAQRLLGLAALGNVTKYQHDSHQFAAIVADGRARHVDGVLLSGAVDE